MSELTPMTPRLAVRAHNAICRMTNCFTENGPVETLAYGPGGTVEEIAAGKEITEALAEAQETCELLRVGLHDTTGEDPL
jgi:hypothetical protein